MKEYNKAIDDKEQIEYLEKWNEKQKLKKKKRKEKIERIKEFLGGKR